MTVVGLMMLVAARLQAQERANVEVEFASTAAIRSGPPAMISAIRHDSVVAQIETVLRSVLAGRQLTLRFALRPGHGVHIVEFATGGISREEVAARLQRLEAAVADL